MKTISAVITGFAISIIAIGVFYVSGLFDNQVSSQVVVDDEMLQPQLELRIPDTKPDQDVNLQDDFESTPSNNVENFSVIEHWFQQHVVGNGYFEELNDGTVREVLPDPTGTKNIAELAAENLSEGSESLAAEQKLLEIGALQVENDMQELTEHELQIMAAADPGMGREFLGMPAENDMRELTGYDLLMMEAADAGMGREFLEMPVESEIGDSEYE